MRIHGTLPINLTRGEYTCYGWLSAAHGSIDQVQRSGSGLLINRMECVEMFLEKGI